MLETTTYIKRKKNGVFSLGLTIQFCEHILNFKINIIQILTEFIIVCHFSKHWGKNDEQG